MLHWFFCLWIKIVYFNLERERGRERNIDTREKHQLGAHCTCLNWGLNPWPRYVSWPGIKPTAFQLWDDTPTNWAARPGQAISFYKNISGSNIVPLFLKSFYLFIFREKRMEGERARNINVWLSLVRPQLGTCPTSQACALTGNWTSDPLVRRPELNLLSHNSQGWYSTFNTQMNIYSLRNLHSIQPI